MFVVDLPRLFKKLMKMVIDKERKRYFILYGLQEYTLNLEDFVDEDEEVGQFEEKPEIKDMKRSAFWHYFLNWGAVLLLIFGVVVAVLGQFDRGDDWESVDPNIVADYALFSAGAEVVDTPEAEVYRPESSNPEIVLLPSKNPGECWAFRGKTATLRIRLSHLIVPKSVTLEHISIKVSPSGNINSAPKDFSVHGVDDDLLEFMGNFQYTGETPQQTFLLKPDTKLAYPYRVIQFSFHDNHGHPDYTCVYKIRVHGSPAKY